MTDNSSCLAEDERQKLRCEYCELGVKDCQCSDKDEPFHFYLPEKQKGDSVS